MAHSAAIHNIELVRIAAERLVNRNAALPGIACLYGPAGYGKTTAATAVANETRAYFVALRSAWGRKALLEKILLEMSIRPSGTVPQLLDQVCAQLASSNRLLILDEFDYAVHRDTIIELTRDIYEGSQATLLIIGEEMLPRKLQKWERFHSRVLSWIPAQPVSVADTRELAKIYAPDIEIANDLLTHLVKISAGSVRRISVNLSNIHEEASLEGWRNVSLGDWGDRPLYTGDAPRRGA